MDAVPDSVHMLRPSDIAVIGAMGNSITAGFGMLGNINELYTTPTDYRGLSWSAGMVDGYTFSWYRLNLNLPFITTFACIASKDSNNIIC